MGKSKLILSIFILTIIIGGSIAYINANQPDSIDYNSTFQVVNSIEDERAREVVLDLFYAPVYSTFTTSEVKDGEQSETEDQYDANRNEELKEEIKILSKLTGDALDEEVKKIVKEVLDENINKKDLKWNQEFVDKYVKEYWPEYLPVIEEKTDGEINVDDPLYYKRDDV